MTIPAAGFETDLRSAYTTVRALTDRLRDPLSAEDQTAQSIPHASSTKWHRAHTSWFFEEFLLRPVSGYRPYDEAFRCLFNSYYEAVGPRHPRAGRGLVTRPGATAIGRYRAHVDAAMDDLITAGGFSAELDLLTLGLHHEQQHQELLVMDAKHLLSCYPFGPALVERAPDGDPEPVPPSWREVDGGLVDVGSDGTGFAFDHEAPRHTALLRPFRIAERAVTNADWLHFMADGGYDRPELWLSDGWHTRQAGTWRAPEYWRQQDDGWQAGVHCGRDPTGAPGRTGLPCLLLRGRRVRPLGRCAAAHRAGMRSGACNTPRVRGQLLDPTRLHPGIAGRHMVGDVWEWTASADLPYPGFAPAAGAVREYSGKLMCDQHVLRGASCPTPVGHDRLTCRNFFPAAARWVFSELRLVAAGPRMTDAAPAR